ncbi:hypothetical protein SAMN02745866_01401 [Alteromonadaceae bacterium Bs31]|nr:hypothetical protein SAMN02745866_01401 [Alteromonadaceae bacterium Bs31]
MSDEKMSSVVAAEPKQAGGINIIVVVILVLLAVIVGWYLGQSGAKPQAVNFLPPASGVLDYYLSVNEEAQPTPYAPTAEAFTPCVENCFEGAVTREDLEVVNRVFEGRKGYFVWEEGEQSAISTKQGSVSLFEQAHAAAPGCYVVMVYRIGSSTTYIYNKPGCP